MTEVKKRRGFFVTLWRLLKMIGFLARLLVMVAGSWIVLSRLLMPRRLPLPHALGGERRTFGFNGLELSYYVSGEGKPLVLLHSINAAASAYETKPLYDYFAASRRVYALDLPGFGFSSRPDIVYSPRLYTDAVLAFVRLVAQTDGPADVVALSLSSEFAARAAEESPELFRSLTLISPTGFGRRVRSRGSDALLGVLQAPLWSQALYDLLTTKRSIRFFLNMLFASRRTDENLAAYGYLTARQPGARFAPLYFISGKLFSADIRQIYDRLNLPVLVIYNRDPFAGYEALSAYKERPNWRLVRIEGTRGLPHFERSRETCAALEAFLQDYAMPHTSAS